MFLLASGFLGVSDLNTATPPNVKYDKLKICSQDTTLVVDEINMLNIHLEKSEALALTSEQSWSMNSIMLAHLENTLDAGNLSSEDLPITDWRFLRRKVGELDYIEIALIENIFTTSYVDIEVISGQEYEYAIQSISNGVRGLIVEGGAIAMVTIDRWVLSNLDGDINYIIDTDLDSSGVRTNVKRSEFEVDALYPVIYYGQPNYRKGTLKFVLKQLNLDESDYDYAPKELISEFDNFINNKTVKILRNSNGLAMQVETSDFEYINRENVKNNKSLTGGVLYDVSFSYTQVGIVG